MKKAITITLLGLGILTLSACNTNKGPSGAAAMRGSNGSAQTYAMQANNNYHAKRDQNGFYRNSMSAPSNQTYYFAFNSSQMRQQDLRALMVQAKFLSSHPNAKVRLEGNTDNRGSREYNVGLGWRRDQSVARILKQQGVRASQIRMVSYGKERPAVTGNNEHAWALNRRVNFVYTAN